MFDVPTLLIIIILAALIFDFTNGAHDCANAIATVVSTKVLSPKSAIVLAASLNFIGALLGEEVALTLGSGIVNADIVSGSQTLVLAALVGAIVWNSITWYFGIPSSSSHALIGGLMGAAIAHIGVDSLNVQSIIHKVIIPLFASPLAGFFMGVILMGGISILFFKVNRKFVNNFFRKSQIFSAAIMALSHGLNDAQKTMGVITLGLVIFGYVPGGADMHIPTAQFRN